MVKHGTTVTILDSLHMVLAMHGVRQYATFLHKLYVTNLLFDLLFLVTYMLQCPFTLSQTSKQQAGFSEMNY